VSRRWLAVGLIAGVLSAALVRASSQAPAPVSQPQPVFRVGVDAVRIDAVVTDRDGRIVTDLTAKDFELRQDGKIQDITLARFVPVQTSAERPAPPAPPAKKGEPAPPPPPATKLSKEQVQRSIALVVDDLSLSAESFEYTRQGLHKFIDTQLQPTDLVALVRTSAPGGTLQPFTTDRRLLHAQVDGMRWTAFSRNGVESFEAFQGSFLGIGMPATPGIDSTDFSLVNQLRTSMSAAGSIGALNLIIRGASQLPGRRAIVLLSEGFALMTNDRGAYIAEPRTRIALDRAIEAALRHGVVVYSVDARGLQTGGVTASDNPVGNEGDFARSVTSDGSRLRFIHNTQEGLTYVAEQTGGKAVLDTNDIGAGIARVVNDIRSYYILGYTPDEGTFAKPGKTPRLHKIALKVKRPGLTVRTRKTFLGISDPPAAPKITSVAQELRDAALSPFTVSDISMRATTLPGYGPDGAFVRTLLEIDARALSFAKGDDGRTTADVDVVGMAFDQDGTEVGHMTTAFTVALSADMDPEALRDGEGLVYVLKVPIPKPGAYQIRFSARDRRSGAIGSAGQFASIDDVAHGAFAMSGILLGPESATASSSKPAEGLDTSGLLKQQAHRVFKPGTRLSYAYEIYNAQAPVQASATIWRGQERVFTSPADTLVPPPTTTDRFAAAGGLKLGPSLPPGDYVLQIAARTSEAKTKKKGAAVQSVDFEVR
jgi:VWFA-related protein